MARTKHTYAIRLAVEGGGQVKADLVSVGQSGEQSLGRIETAGERSQPLTRPLPIIAIASATTPSAHNAPTRLFHL